jgi:hypothetical protein
VSNAPLILSLIGNIALAGFNYLGARQQNATARHGIDAQSTREHEARGEDHFRHRQALYHNYLDAYRELQAIILAERPNSDRILEWRRGYEHCLNAVVLFGSEPVRQAADSLHNIVKDLNRDTTGGELTSDRAIQQRMEELSDDLGRQFRTAVDAMRADIAP